MANQENHHPTAGGSQQDDKRSLLSSRLVERAMGYSWVKWGWDTTTRAYSFVKESNRAAKVGGQQHQGKPSPLTPYVCVVLSMGANSWNARPKSRSTRRWWRAPSPFWRR